MRNYISDQRGFTLIDVTIALLIIGILVTPFIQQYRIWLATSNRMVTQDNLNLSNQAIEQYYFANNRYPCPADPRVTPGNANYGAELRLPGGQCDVANLVPFTVTSVRDADGAGGNDPVFIGMVPFQTLGLTPDQALDAWNNKLTYAVSSLLTDENTYDGTFGGISVLSNEVVRPAIATGGAANADSICTPVGALTAGAVLPQFVYNPPQNIHYIVMSHGEDGSGAYYNNNTAPNACPAGGDDENCNNIAGNEAIFLYDECQSDPVYDDIFLTNKDLAALALEPFAAWDNGDNQNDVGASVGYIGINNLNPQAQLDVVGNIRAELDPTDPNELGRVHSTEYCEVGGANCMRAEVIAGTDPNMNCSANNTAMRGIANNSARCAQVINGLSATTCPSGPPQQYVTGFTAAGGVCCNGVCP